jgi:N,N'-diacetyllegionaminate synthase
MEMNRNADIIAEAGSVHDGSVGNALRMIEAAAAAGADVIKFQTHIAAAETLRSAPSPAYFTAESRYEYFERTAFTRDEWRRLKKACEEASRMFMSSVFSAEAVDLMESVGLDTYKIPSGEVTNLPLLDLIAQTGKPLVLSSGMSDWAELDAAVNTILRRHDRVTVLQCTSEYPCPYEQVGLNVMREIRDRYRLPVGLSDHTLTNYASFAAVTLGATTIEKHFTLSRLMYGSDAKHSLEPREFTDLVDGIRAIERMVTHDVDKNDVDRFDAMKIAFQKSLVSRCRIAAGAPIDAGMVAIKKPGTGLPPSRMAQVIGRRALRTIEADQVIVEEDIDWSIPAGAEAAKGQ